MQNKFVPRLLIAYHSKIGPKHLNVNQGNVGGRKVLLFGSLDILAELIIRIRKSHLTGSILVPISRILTPKIIILSCVRTSRRLKRLSKVSAPLICRLKFTAL